MSQQTNVPLVIYFGFYCTSCVFSLVLTYPYILLHNFLFSIAITFKFYFSANHIFIYRHVKHPLGQFFKTRKSMKKVKVESRSKLHQYLSSHLFTNRQEMLISTLVKGMLAAVPGMKEGSIVFKLNATHNKPVFFLKS